MPSASQKKAEAQTTPAPPSASQKAEAQATPAPRTKPFVYLIACIAALGGVIYGWDVGGAGGTFLMTGFQVTFGWEASNDTQKVRWIASDSEKDVDKGLINGMFALGAIFGSLFNNYPADRYGRRAALGISAVVFVTGAIVEMCAAAMAVLWVGRLIGGFGIGMLCLCVPIYIAEAAPDHSRGLLSTIWQLSICFGIPLAGALNIALKEWDEGWRISYGGNAIFAVGLLVAIPFLPESPRWLAAKGRTAELRESLLKLRYEDEVAAAEAKVMAEVVEEEELGVASWSEVFSSENNLRYRLLLGMSLQMFQQLSGINAIMFYAPDILTTFFGDDVSLGATLVLYVVMFLGTCITLYAVDRYGRVQLLVVGGLSMFASLLVFAILAFLPQSEGIGYAVTAMAAIYVISFGYTWGPVVWVVCSEIFPVRARGKACCITTASSWVMVGSVGVVFPFAEDASLGGSFIFFAAMILIGTAIVYFYLPETAKLDILQINALVQSFRRRPLSRAGCAGLHIDDASAAAPMVATADVAWTTKSTV